VSILLLIFLFLPWNPSPSLPPSNTQSNFAEEILRIFQAFGSLHKRSDPVTFPSLRTRLWWSLLSFFCIPARLRRSSAIAPVQLIVRFSNYEHVLPFCPFLSLELNCRDVYVWASMLWMTHKLTNRWRVIASRFRYFI